MNLLSRSEYFHIETNIADNQLNMENLFTPPHTLSFIKSQPIIPTIAFRLIKGPVDISSIHISNQTTDFIATIISNSPLGFNLTITESINSTNGVVDKCFSKVNFIKIELTNINISTSQQNFDINITTCEHTLRMFFTFFLKRSLIYTYINFFISM